MTKLSTTTMLANAIHIAAEAHRKQRDKSKKPYILHCLQVMNSVSHYGDDELMAIAVLHDLIEDTIWTEDMLRDAGFSERIISGVVAMTHNDGEEYRTYLFRVADNKDAIKVKIADLTHNIDLTRLKKVTDKDVTRAKKYHEALFYLMRCNCE